jgi:hypothetical protein
MNDLISCHVVGCSKLVYSQTLSIIINKCNKLVFANWDSILRSHFPSLSLGFLATKHIITQKKKNDTFKIKAEPTTLLRSLKEPRNDNVMPQNLISEFHIGHILGRTGLY